MAIPMPDEGDLPRGALRDFVQVLHQIYDQAGQPAARLISRTIVRALPASQYESVSHETVSAALRGGGPPPAWPKVRSIVAALRTMVDAETGPPPEIGLVHALWIAARAETAGAAPARPDPPAPPVRPPPVQVPARRPARPDVRPRALPAGVIVGPLPPLNEHFVERGDMLVRMHATLRAQPGNPLVLYGTTGTGKTQLAREYVRMHGADHTTVWWIQAGSRAAAEESFTELGRRIGAPLPIADVRSRLAGRAGDHLLVFDGVEDESVLELMPTAGGHVIVTSCDPGLGRAPSSSGIEVHPFSGPEAWRFLALRGDEITEEQADLLIASVGRLPLALEQAAAAREVAATPWAAWLDRLAAEGAAVLGAGRPRHYPAPILDMLRSRLDRLQGENRRAAELFAALAPGPIPLSMLGSGLAGETPNPLSAALRNPLTRGQMVRQLTGAGLVRLQDEQDRLEVEPVLRLVLRSLLPDDVLERAHHAAHAVLAAADPGWPDDVAAVDMHREIAAHVDAACLVGSPLRAARETVYHQIRYHYLVGDYRAACTLAEAAVAGWRAETALGPDDPLVLQATRQWANALRALGRHEQAWHLTADGLSRLRSNPDYGDDHPQTLDMRGSHASDLRVAGEYRRALDTAADIYESYRQRRGDADSRTAAARHNKAVSHRLLGEFLLAEELDRVTLAQNQETRGDADRRTMLSRQALAEDLYGQGRYREVLALLADRVENRVAEPDPFDLGAMLAERTWALATRGLGDVAAARARLAAHHARCRRLLGDAHQHTLAARMSLATTLLQAGDLAGAQEHATAVHAGYRDLLGPRNPLALASLVNLAAVLRQTGDLGRSRSLDAVASEALRDVLGTQHPYTIAAMIGLAGDYAVTARPAGAVLISTRAVEAARATWGDSHPNTLVAAANRILDLIATGSAGAADQLRRQVLDRIRDTLGDQHPMLAAVHEQRRLECLAEIPSL